MECRETIADMLNAAGALSLDVDERISNPQRGVVKRTKRVVLRTSQRQSRQASTCTVPEEEEWGEEDASGELVSESHLLANPKQQKRWLEKDGIDSHHSGADSDSGVDSALGGWELSPSKPKKQSAEENVGVFSFNGAVQGRLADVATTEGLMTRVTIRELKEEKKDVLDPLVAPVESNRKEAASSSLLPIPTPARRGGNANFKRDEDGDVSKRSATPSLPSHSIWEEQHLTSSEDEAEGDCSYSSLYKQKRELLQQQDQTGQVENFNDDFSWADEDNTRASTSQELLTEQKGTVNSNSRLYVPPQQQQQSCTTPNRSTVVGNNSSSMIKSKNNEIVAGNLSSSSPSISALKRQLSNALKEVESEKALRHSSLANLKTEMLAEIVAEKKKISREKKRIESEQENLRSKISEQSLLHDELSSLRQKLKDLQGEVAAKEGRWKREKDRLQQHVERLLKTDKEREGGGEGNQQNSIQQQRSMTPILSSRPKVSTPSSAMLVRKGVPIVVAPRSVSVREPPRLSIGRVNDKDKRGGGGMKSPTFTTSRQREEPDLLHDKDVEEGMQESLRTVSSEETTRTEELFGQGQTKNQKDDDTSSQNSNDYYDDASNGHAKAKGVTKQETSTRKQERNDEQTASTPKATSSFEELERFPFEEQFKVMDLRIEASKDLPLVKKTVDEATRRLDLQYKDRRELVYAHGLRKIMWNDERISVFFHNGDRKELTADQTICYYYKSTETIQVTYTHGDQFFK